MKKSPQQKNKYQAIRYKIIVPLILAGVFVLFKQLMLIGIAVMLLGITEISAAQENLSYFLGLGAAFILLVSLLDYLIERILFRVYHRYEGLFTPLLYDQLFRGRDERQLGSKRPVFLRYGILRDIIQIRDSHLQGLVHRLLELLMLPLWGFFVLWLDWQAGLLVIAHVAVMVVLLFLGLLFARYGQRRAEQVTQQTLDKLEITRNAGVTILAMGLYARLRQIWVHSRLRELLLHIQQANRMLVFQSLIRACYLSNIVVILMISSAHAQTQVGLLLALMWVSVFAPRPLLDLTADMRLWLKARLRQPEMLKRVKNISDEKPHWARELKGDIALEDIKIIMPDTIDPVLSISSLNIASGEIIGVIGNIGSGKSILCKLLAGIQNYQGTALIDGVDYREWNRELLGTHIGYLPQEIDLLPGTVSENICRFTPHAREDDVVHAAKLAGADEHIRNLEKSYATEISVGDDSIPYGLKQRIAIARAFFGLPQVIILDAPTAQLDHRALAHMRESIAELKKQGKTLILATHSRSFLEITDRIAVLHNHALAACDKSRNIIAKM